MKWFWIITVFYLVTQVQSWPTIGDVPPDPPPITRIDRVTETDINICMSGVNINDEFYTLSLLTDEKDTNYESTGKKDNCISFGVGIQDWTQDWSERKILKLIVHLDTDYQNVVAQGSVAKFPVVPFDLKYSLVKYPVQPNTENYLLRIKGNDLKNLVLESPSTLLVNEQSVAYYNGITSDTYTSKACYNTDEGIQVCDREIAITAVTVDPVTFDSATLELDNSAVNLLPKTITGDESFDIIVTDKNDQPNKFCPSQSNTLLCAVTRNNPGEDIFNIRVIKTKKDDITGTSIVTIHDRDLYLSHIGDDILEGIWVHTHEKTDTSKNYQFHLFDGVPGTPVTVDCTHLHETHCYGYITGLANVKHSMKVKPIAGTGPNTTDENQNTYEPTTPQELAILSRHMTRHANQLMADVNICFQHLTPPEGGAFSHYEMLIINEKGQWLKHKILEEEEGGEEEVREGRLCFAPFTINTKDFDLTKGTKVVISQRGVDGFTVLATGESKLL